MRIGLIADTHGLLRPEAVAALQGCAHILHAGDIGKPEVLAGLASIAPVTAVRGNNDTAAWAAALPQACWVALGGVGFWLLHDIHDLQRLAPPRPPGVVVCGHSHKPVVEARGAMLVVNPGSAGPRRFSLPVTLAVVGAVDATPSAHIVSLLPRP